MATISEGSAELTFAGRSEERANSAQLKDATGNYMPGTCAPLTIDGL